MVQLLQDAGLRQELPPGLLGPGAALAVVGPKSLDGNVESAAETSYTLENAKLYACMQYHN